MSRCSPALARRIWAERRKRATSGQFDVTRLLLPALLAAAGSTLAERAAAWAARVRTSEETVAAIQAEIDDLAFRLYGLDAADRAALTATLATEATGDAEAEASEDEEEEVVTADAPALAADLLAYASAPPSAAGTSASPPASSPPPEPDPLTRYRSARPACCKTRPASR